MKKPGNDRFDQLRVLIAAPGSQSIGSREQQSVAQRAASMVSSSLVDTTGPGVIGSSSGMLSIFGCLIDRVFFTTEGNLKSRIFHLKSIYYSEL